MRAVILVATTVLALAACRGSDQAGSTNGADNSLSAGSIVTNDITAIDAVTGADANMAADINYLPGVSNASGNEGSAHATTPRSSARGAGSASADSAVPVPAQNNSAPASNATN